MTATGKISGRASDTTQTVRMVLATVIIIACLSACTALIIIIVTHGGFTNANTNAIMLMAGMVGTSGIPSICQLILTGKMYRDVSNGLIPAKLQEGLQDSQTQEILSAAVNGPTQPEVPNGNQ